ncbi:putative ATP-dependent DNA helicase HFM1 [Huso huso]|uniref:DNA 3'-5' helicase n=1 Tax=Huso huso TaxID=61971 RepID=A0ABR0ZHP8_HUSHU
MFEPEDYTMTLDSLFFERPVVQKVTPLCNDQGSWQLAPAPSISEIPATQDLQNEIKSLWSSGSTERPKKFIPPMKKTTERENSFQEKCNLQNDEIYEIGLEATSINSQQILRNESSDTQLQQDSAQLLDLRTLHPSSRNHGANNQFRKSLFKTPQPKILRSFVNTSSGLETSEPGDSSNVTLSEFIDDEFVKTVENIQSPLHGSGLELFSTCDSATAKYRQTTKTAHVLPLTPQPLNVQGVSSKGSGVLRPVTEIPAQFRSVFKEFPYFNYIQSGALDELLYTNRNFVICAPTGSGKTVLFELAIIRLLMEVPPPWSNIKAVYMAPIKALCSQRYDDWKPKFGPLGLNCKELTGDTEMDDFFEIQDAQLIMTTPEKWDSMTRKWRDNCLVQLVRLFLIDEVHVVKDPTRGATLEVVVSRMKTMHSSLSCGSDNPDSKVPMRFVAVSATIPNITDISDWLSDGTEPATCLEMDETHRPVKLRKVVLGFPCSGNQTEFKFDLSLNYKMASIIQTYSDQKPTLVFCATRKGVQQSGSVLAKDAKFIMSIEHKQRLQKCANSLQDSKLRDLVMYGVGFHHAGMEVSDRKKIESVFTLGDLPVLFTTSTLAMGVNLPAHLVVIKSTMHYIGGMFQEYSETDILQMIGRAGRPQFDTTATAVIMTRFQTKEKYTHLVSGADTIESSLHKHLVEHLNAEIVLHTISNVKVALDWIRSTFLYIRALKNPSHYGFPPGLDRAGIEAKLQELCLKNLNALSSIGLITMDEDINFKPTETGKLMARYCIAYDTMKQFTLVPGTGTLSDLLTLISKSKEFSDVQLRVNEKRTLNTLNKDKNRITIRFPIDGKIKNNEMKVNCLIQAQLGCMAVQDFGLTQDTGRIFRNGTRLTKCLSEFFAQHAKKNFSALLNSLILAKCFRSRLWENSPFVSKQLEKIGVTLSTAMVNAGLTTFQKIEETHARELEMIVNRHPPFGNQIREAVIHLPKYEVSVEQIARYNASIAEIIVTVNLTNYEQLRIKRTAPDNHYVTLLIGDCDNEVVFQQKLTDSLLLKSGSWSKKIEVTRALKGEELSVNLISSEYVGLDIQQKYSAFYSGPKRFGTHANMWEKPQSEHLQVTAQSAETSVVRTPRSSKEITCPDPAKRQCNHYCKNKEQCGHECCKVGVPVLHKSVTQPQSNFSSYLRDLKSRNETLAVTPVKRLKMKMSEDVDAVDLQQFSYTRKTPVSSVARRERMPTGLPTQADKWEALDDFATPQLLGNVDYYGEDNENYSCSYPNWNVMEYEDQISVPSTAASKSKNNDRGHCIDYHNWNIKGLEDQLPALDTAKSEKFSVWNKSINGNLRNPTLGTQNKAAMNFVKQSMSDADESGYLSSDTLNVTFDLGVDDWDDFDDESLVHASNLTTAEIPKPKPERPEGFSSTLFSKVDQAKPALEEFHRSGTYRQVTTAKDSSAVQTSYSSAVSYLPPDFRRFSNETTKCYTEMYGNKPASSYSRENETKLSTSNGMFDFFTKQSNVKSALEVTGRHEEEDKSNDVNAFLGIFDGIF